MAVEHLHVFVVLMFELGYRLVWLRLMGHVCEPFVHVAVWFRIEIPNQDNRARGAMLKRVHDLSVFDKIARGVPVKVSRHDLEWFLAVR